MKNLELYEGFFDKEKKTGDSMMDFIASVEKQAYKFVYDIKKQADKECDKDAKKKGYNEESIKNFKKMYIKFAMKKIVESAMTLDEIKDYVKHQNKE